MTDGVIVLDVENMAKKTVDTKSLVVYYSNAIQASSIPCVVYTMKYGGLHEIGRFTMGREAWSAFVMAFESVCEFRPTVE